MRWCKGSYCFNFDQYKIKAICGGSSCKINCVKTAMKILINSINYYPELTGIGKYTGEMGAWLAGQGHDVVVITAPPYYPAWKISEGYSGLWFKTEEIDGARVIRCPLWVPSVPTGVTRVLHLLSFALSCLPVMLWKGLFWRPDIVQVVEPPIACAPGAWLAAKLGDSMAWLHVQDFEVDAAFELGLLPEGPIASLAHALERFVMRRFDRVSTISRKMKDLLGQKGIDPEKQFLFENWTDIDQIKPLSGEIPLRAELNVPKDKIVLLYSGNMGAKQGLEILAELANSLERNEEIILLLCGDGVMRRALEQMTSSQGNVLFLPLQPLERLNELLNLADIHLLPQRTGAEDLVMPSKLLNMLSSGRPVVATAREGTQVSEVVQLCGKVVPPGNVKKFTEALLYLVDNADERNRLGKAGREFAEKNWELNAVLSKAFSNI